MASSLPRIEESVFSDKQESSREPDISAMQHEFKKRPPKSFEDADSQGA